MRKARLDSSLTVEGIIKFLLPRFPQSRKVPSWPPDVFAICATLLNKSGTYSHVFAKWPPQKFKGNKTAWADHAAAVGKTWRSSWVSGKAAPKEVNDLWNVVLSFRLEPVETIETQSDLWEAVVSLCAIADEASEGVGTVMLSGEEYDREFVANANIRLLPHYGGSACIEVHPSRGRVLPKMHTPQSGLTVRSLSHYLALVPLNETLPVWAMLAGPTLRTSRSMRLLLIPWPLSFDPQAIRPADPSPHEMANMPDCFGFFTYDPAGVGEDVVEVVMTLKTQAEKSGAIDGIILPECALNENQCSRLVRRLANTDCFLIAGCGSPATNKAAGENKVVMAFPRLGLLEQRKHHRWKLDSSQVASYNLSLNKEVEWWEYIPIGARRFVITTVGDNFTLASLICEDLARPDPVGEVIRAVGPNLIIALLMDGPQIRERWSARYATVLADDPGSSVLSLSNLGFVQAHKNFAGNTGSRTIGIWKDGKGKYAIELKLKEGAEAMVLNLELKYQTEWTADGRSDGASALVPTLQDFDRDVEHISR